MTPPVILTSGESRAEIMPTEGGVAVNFWHRGISVLAKTPWSESVVESHTAATDENSWVRQWRGGWQVCAPNTGSSISTDGTRAFHGAASQSEWEVVSSDEMSLKLRWQDSAGALELRREWSIDENGGLSAETSATNFSHEAKFVGFAEHLILGTQFLEPIGEGSIASLDMCPKSSIVELDYSGAPTGKVFEANSERSEFSKLSARQQAKVFALVNLERKSITIQVEDWIAKVDWEGLEHALVWQEFGTSKDDPWNGEVFALGIEPTNVAHGLGANALDGPFLPAGQTISWRTSLTVTRKQSRSHDSTT